MAIDGAHVTLQDRQGTSKAHAKVLANLMLCHLQEQVQALGDQSGYIHIRQQLLQAE